MKRNIGKTTVLISALLVMVALTALPVNAADYTLGIFGNANMDDTINEDDITYVEGIIDGTNEVTELADANYDGKVDEDDITQIELIIGGEEKELTVVNSEDQIVTVKKPIEKIAVISDGEHAEALRILDAMDKVVGVSDVLIEREYAKAFYPEFQGLPNIGHYYDYETILSLNPDAVIAYTWSHYPEIEENLPGVTVLRFNFYIGETMFNEMKQLGYILDNREEAQNYIDFVEGYENIVNDKVESLSENEMPKVYIEGSKDWWTFNKDGGPAYQLRMAGCRNIAENLAGSSVGTIQIDPEYVVEQNPDIIIKLLGWDSAGGYGADDPAPLRDTIDEIMNRPELQHVNAVQNGEVYGVTLDINYHPSMIVSAAYFAKWFHPDIFKDLDPRAIHQEYLDTFHEILNWNAFEQGVFVYPPLEE